jgi:arginine N-succinyltransferase
LLVIRDVQRSDLRELERLAGLHDTASLPRDPKTLQESIDRSVWSFDARIRDPFAREYLFVLEDAEKEKVVGTSLIVAQQGTRDAPHVFFDLYEKEHYSQDVDRHFRHRVLQIGYSFDGPTEIGGLVVHPDWRGRGKPGKQLSYVRFLYIAMHPTRFRDRVLVELLPRLEEDGRSPLWEALGRKFTGLSYQEADRLSRQNKEFIQQLFPPGEIYTTLFSQKLQEAIGAVGPQSEGARAVFERLGFRFDDRIDPFDGGPHWSAATERLEPIRRFLRTRLSADELPDGAAPGSEDLSDRLVALERAAGRNRFRCLRATCRIHEGKIELTSPARDALGARPGDRLSSIPFEG